jgi:hypothetical protein
MKASTRTICPAHSKRPQDAHAVGMQQDTRPDRMPGGAALYEFCRKAASVQGRGQAEPGDPSPDNQDAFKVGHFSLLSLPTGLGETCQWSFPQLAFLALY